MQEVTTTPQSLIDAQVKRVIDRVATDMAVDQLRKAWDC